ncbi:hypothetical protein MC885_019651 [Smutsia gigantea]|nr:hypothetical protein MC885_019651 [Smutsia gigantea]
MENVALAPGSTTDTRLSSVSRRAGDSTTYTWGCGAAIKKLLLHKWLRAGGFRVFLGRVRPGTATPRGPPGPHRPRPCGRDSPPCNPGCGGLEIVGKEVREVRADHSHPGSWLRYHWVPRVP